MRKLTFKQFISDYEEYYQDKITTIKSESDMQEILYNIYDTDNFEMDYENKLIELY